MIARMVVTVVILAAVIAVGGTGFGRESFNPATFASREAILASLEVSLSVVLRG